jgi:hypothetical protein
MIDEKEFNHSRKRILEIYHSERAIANLDIQYENKIKKLFRGKNQQEKYLHEKGVTAILKEMGIRYEN